MTGCVGTIPYMAPEVIGLEKYNELADVWNIGVMAFMLLTGQVLFNPKDPQLKQHILDKDSV